MHKAKGTGVPTHDVTYFCLHFRSAPTVVHRKQWAAVTVVLWGATTVTEKRETPWLILSFRLTRNGEQNL